MKYSISSNLEAALKKFGSIDWSFADAKTNIGLHGIHPYPAKFVPQIPRHLLELFHPIVRAPVLDPFCGSGTTLVECRAMGIPSFGIDINPIATLVSRVKTNPPEVEISPIAIMIVDTASRIPAESSPDIPRLDHWFTSGAKTALTKLTCRIAEIPNQQLKSSLQLALSRIIVRVSKQDSDTRYAAVDRSVEEEDVYRQFLDSAKYLDRVFGLEYTNLFRKKAVCDILTKDVLAVEPSDLPHKYGLIITSPPYPNAYEYWLYHKYRMYWLGLDPIVVRNAEIGARAHYFRRNPATADDFRKQMSLCFRLFRKSTVPSSIVCIVVGRSIIRGNVIDNSKLVRLAADEQGYNYLASKSRNIPSTRKAFNPEHGSINSELLLVFIKK